MVAHGMLIKELYAGAAQGLSFIGPCIAKKEEAEGDVRTRGYVDGVITFEELEQWLAGENIRLCASAAARRWIIRIRKSTAFTRCKTA